MLCMSILIMPGIMLSGVASKNKMLVTPGLDTGPGLLRLISNHNTLVIIYIYI